MTEIKTKGKLAVVINGNMSVNSSRNSVRRKENPERPKRTARRMENSTTWCLHSDPGRCSTKIYRRWSTTVNVPSNRAQRAAERGPSPNSTSEERCLLLVEMRHYTRVHNALPLLLSRPHSCRLPKYFWKIYRGFSKHVNQLTVFVLKMTGVVHQGKNEQKGLHAL